VSVRGIYFQFPIGFSQTTYRTDRGRECTTLSIPYRILTEIVVHGVRQKISVSFNSLSDSHKFKEKQPFVYTYMSFQFPIGFSLDSSGSITDQQLNFQFPIGFSLSKRRVLKALLT